MRNISLATKSCGSVALCGISTRFRVLSPTHRQVAHALLTRPPLSYLSSTRKLPNDNSVRLECVKHAASVHPEPGSNSRKIFYYLLPLQVSYNLFRVAFLLASLTLLSIYNSLTRFRISHFAMLCTCLLLFNFQ